MRFRTETGSRGLKITRNPYGSSIEIADTNPATRFLPPDPREVRRALRRAERITQMPPLSAFRRG